MARRAHTRAAAGSSLLGSLLWETGRLDPAVYALACLGLGGVVVVASWLPARRAVRVDPVETLRSE